MKTKTKNMKTRSSQMKQVKSTQDSSREAQVQTINKTKETSTPSDTTTSDKIQIIDVGDKKIKIINIIRELTRPRLGLKETKDLIESDQKTFDVVDSDKAKKQLEAAGAKVKIVK
jgi:ribosomal protein L7/L12